MEDLDYRLSPALMTNAANKPWTTYDPIIVSDPGLQLLSHSQFGASFPAAMSSGTRFTLSTGTSQIAIGLGRHASQGSGAHRSDLVGQEVPSYAYEFEAPSQHHTPGPSTLGQGFVGSIQQDEARRF
ncbi:Hypothetical protein PHPALM_8595 [Phytophthora palmivora]|uniref:Uncharacterized protein n=1 Tax=Phytophthora palmivora TaxID=4796 RepID=A0A2P4Y9F5_9STRA|nr:Hypothetical protein PHPALM_8595 [Phytophthora palmivora]